MPEKKRCSWCGTDPLYVKYHDTEWGRPVHDDRIHFEFLILEGAQAGLSWITILRRREGYRKAFSNFDVKKVARYDAKKMAALLKDESIIRNRLKINAAIENAKMILQLQKEFGSFEKWLESHHPKTKEEWVQLFKKTFRFTGGEIVNEFLMSIGYLSGAHSADCAVYKKIQKAKPLWMR